MLTFRVVDRPPGSDPRTGVIFELATNRSNSSESDNRNEKSN